MYYPQIVPRTPTIAASQMIRGCTTQMDQAPYYQPFMYFPPNIVQEQAIMSYENMMGLNQKQYNFLNPVKDQVKHFYTREPYIKESEKVQISSSTQCQTFIKVSPNRKTDSRATSRSRSVESSLEKSISNSSLEASKFNSNVSDDHDSDSSNKTSGTKKSKKCNSTVSSKSSNKIAASSKQKTVKATKKSQKQKNAKKSTTKNQGNTNKVKKKNFANKKSENKIIKLKSKMEKVPIINENVPIINETNSGKKKKKYVREVLHLGNYLVPTIASILKRNRKSPSANILERMPFVNGQSLSKSHNIAVKVQENNILINKLFSRTKHQKLNYNFQGLNRGQRNTATHRRVSKMLKYSQIVSGLNQEEGDKIDLVRNVLNVLHLNYSEKIARHDELEEKLNGNTDCSKEEIDEFKDLCEKMEDEESIIQAMLFLINNVFELNKKVQQLEENPTPRNKKTSLKKKKSKFTYTHKLFNERLASKAKPQKDVSGDITAKVFHQRLLGKF